MESIRDAPRENWSRWARAFRESPWRRQTNIVATLAVVVLSLVAVGGMYLAEASRAATAGRDVQSLRRQRDELIGESEMLRAQIASHQSVALLSERARQLGFVPAAIDQLEFIAMPNYRAPQPAPVASKRPPETSLANLPEYQETLGAWLLRQVPLLLGQGS